MIWIATSNHGDVVSHQYPDILQAERSIRYDGGKKYAIVSPDASAAECRVELVNNPIVPGALSAYLYDLGWRASSEVPAHLMPLYWIHQNGEYRIDLTGEYGNGWLLEYFSDSDDADGVATGRWVPLNPSLEGNSVAELAAALSALQLIVPASVIEESERRSDENTARANAAVLDGGWNDRSEEY